MKPGPSPKMGSDGLRTRSVRTSAAASALLPAISTAAPVASRATVTAAFSAPRASAPLRTVAVTLTSASVASSRTTAARSACCPSAG